MKVYFIPYNIPSSKNNKQFKRGRDKDGTPNPQKDRLIPSAYTMEWINKTKSYFLLYKVQFRNEISGLKPPYYIEFTFIRRDKSKADYHNLVQVLADCMRDAQWIPDDDMDNFMCYFDTYKINKEKPGVEIRILKTKPIHYVDIQTHPTTNS